MNNNKIEAPRIDIPDRIGQPPKPKIDTAMPKQPQTKLDPANPEPTPVPVPVKTPGIVQRLINSITNKLFRRAFQYVADFLIAWLLTFAIFKKDDEGKPVVGEDGKVQYKWGATIAAALASFIGASTLLKEGPLGKTVGEWVQILIDVFANILP